MATTNEVNKQSVKQLLETGRDHLFVIPEYQRPYAWGSDEIQTLFDDLWEFAANSNPNDKGTYFLGSIVSFENENGEQEIIDGQQRITSLFLFLRAIYSLLDNSDSKTKEATNFLNQIEPALWQTDKLTGEVNYSSILLTSRVMNNEGNEVLRKILENGIADKYADDNYSKNYNKFVELLSEAAKGNPLNMYNFFYVILNKAILLPITADTQDTALTIFSTLNDRGLQLSDSDIFKAKIYNQLNNKEKSSFIENWKQLEDSSAEAGESIQSLFYYYMFYLRAMDKDNSTTTPGLRKYYGGNDKKFGRLYESSVIPNLFNILNLWKVINSHESIQNESWSQNCEIKKVLDILSSYPNEFWKYPVVIFYMSFKNNIDFELKFEKFLKKLTTELLSRYLVTPTVNAVKGDIMKLNVEVAVNDHPSFDFKPLDDSLLDAKLKNPHSKAVRMLLKMLAYSEQDELLPDKWEIEHILPQKWQDAYFINHSDEEIKEKLEHLGNKLPFEKKLNIIAGNGYFVKKKKEYSNSAIIITKNMGESKITDWNLDSVSERDIRVSDKIKDIFKNWRNEYSSTKTEVEMQEPTAEQLAMIEEFKKNGWIK